MANKNTAAILKELYPKVEAALKTKTPAFKQCFARFMDKRTEQLFAIGPMDRIFYGTTDADDLFASIGISKDVIKDAISHTYYWQISNFNPRYAKEEVTVLMMCIIRYYFLKNDEKNLDLATIYLSFSGKFYPSIHFNSFPKAEPSKYSHVMIYVINNLTNKYDIKTQGNVLGAIRSIDKTWMKTYGKDFKSFDDEDITYLVQQLHSRIKSFMKNIATLYYAAYENKDYISYNGDAISDDENGEYRLADSDSMKAERIIEKTMEKINTTSVDYRYCKMSADANIKTEEIKSIIESIVNGGKKNMAEVKELIRILVCTYFENFKSREVSDIAFITFSIQPKPNTKDKNINRLKEIVETWLEENSVRYRKRKSRLATKNSYNRAILMYFVLVCHTANK